jgi:hypothetical protein
MSDLPPEWIHDRQSRADQLFIAQVRDQIQGPIVSLSDGVEEFSSRRPFIAVITRMVQDGMLPRRRRGIKQPASRDRKTPRGERVVGVRGLEQS